MNTAEESAKLIIFWDYDTQWAGDRSRSGGGPKQWGYLDFENTERLLKLHAEYDVPACFAVVGAAAEHGKRPYHDPEQIRRIHRAGHEIASHGYRHEWLPGLDGKALRETLRASKDALEQCIGDSVESFVPPYNQPFDYLKGWSVSLSERREGPRGRTDVGRLCHALRETGYRFCRVSYLPLARRMLSRVFGLENRQPNRLLRIDGITCLRMNGPCGFAEAAEEYLGYSLKRGGVAAIYGHPHSLTLGQSQDLRWYEPFLRKVKRLMDEGKLKVTRPRELVEGNCGH